jgi:hypothetical protein
LDARLIIDKDLKIGKHLASNHAMEDANIRALATPCEARKKR